MSEIDAVELREEAKSAKIPAYWRSVVFDVLDALEKAQGEGQRQYEYNVEQIAKQAVLEAEIARWTDYAATLETERPAKDGEIARLREALIEARGWVQDDVNADHRHRGQDVLDRIDAALKGNGEEKMSAPTDAAVRSTLGSQGSPFGADGDGRGGLGAFEAPRSLSVAQMLQAAAGGQPGQREAEHRAGTSDDSE